MALGGGKYLVQNKELAGAYFKFMSVAKATASLGERGVVAMGIDMDWGAEGEIITVENGDFLKNSGVIFGHAYTDDALKGLRDLFLNAKTLLAFRLNGGGVKASNEFATAKYTGTRGNDIKIIVKTNVDEPSKFDVETVLDVSSVDIQTVTAAGELVSNDYVDFNTSATLTETASTPLAGGTNGTTSGASHQAFLDKLEAYSYNILVLDSTDDTTKSLYVTYIKRMRDEVGTNAQLVVHNKLADYEGVISVKNVAVEGESKLVYWVAGKEAGIPLNKSALNDIYDGEYTPIVGYTQTQLKAAQRSGEFVMHKVGDKIRVLDDINTLVTTSDEKGDIFKSNQTMRVLDQIATDIAGVFATKYLGSVQNDASGRISLWADIKKHHEQLAQIRAIENFAPDEDIVVTEGDEKGSVVVNDFVQIVGTMKKLYMQVTIA